jgi:aminocyclopropanecarboxylate oxidase
MRACSSIRRAKVENHGVDAALMDEVKRFVYAHYEEHLEARFHASDLAKNLPAGGGDEEPSDKVDWESTYFIQHRPRNNAADFPEITPPTRSAPFFSLPAVSCIPSPAQC